MTEEITPFNGAEEDLAVTLIAAFRYALYRKSYITSWMSDIVRQNFHIFTIDDLALLDRETKERIDNKWEFDLDLPCWVSLHKAIINEQLRRIRLNDE